MDPVILGVGTLMVFFLLRWMLGGSKKEDATVAQSMPDPDDADFAAYHRVLAKKHRIGEIERSLKTNI